jgi:hypothetical protein
VVHTIMSGLDCSRLVRERESLTSVRMREQNGSEWRDSLPVLVKHTTDSIYDSGVRWPIIKGGMAGDRRASCGLRPVSLGTRQRDGRKLVRKKSARVVKGVGSGFIGVHKPHMARAQGSRTGCNCS